MNSKFAIRDIFYFGGLMLLTISSSLVGRTYLFLVPHLNPALKYGSIVLFFLSLFYKNWRKNVLIKSLALIAVILIVSIITDAIYFSYTCLPLYQVNQKILIKYADSFFGQI